MPGHTDTIAHRWFEEVWHRGREAAIDEMMFDDTVMHGLPEPIRGPEAFKQFYRGFSAAFPDLRITIEEALVDGDMHAVRCAVEGTHTGPGLPAEPKGVKARFTGMCMVRVRDGRIAESWNNFDFLSLYEQLGLRVT